jgi:hypothetical protein
MDGFDKLKNQPSDEDGGENRKTMPRMMARLEELMEEYDEKIRGCSTIVDGMILATQMVRDFIPEKPSVIRFLQLVIEL